MDDARRKEILDYLERASRLSPAQRLKCMGEMRDFLYKNMTPEGWKLFEKRGEYRKVS